MLLLLLIAEKIINTAAEYGIDKKNIICYNEEEFNFSETESSGKNDTTKGPKFITINLKIIFIVVAVIAAILFGTLFICRLYQKNRAKIRKAINIYQKRRFLRRRRYHRRKRRR